jgi:hypothetical protein
LFAIARAFAALAFDAKFVAALGSLHRGASPSMSENAPAADGGRYNVICASIICASTAVAPYLWRQPETIRELGFNVKRAECLFRRALPWNLGTFFPRF